MTTLVEIPIAGLASPDLTLRDQATNTAITMGPRSRPASYGFSLMAGVRLRLASVGTAKSFPVMFAGIPFP